MKKMIAGGMALLLILSLCACKSEAAQNADNLILEIGEVDLTQNIKDKIYKAEQAVKGLKEREYKQLDNIAILEKAKETYSKLSAKEIEEAIDKIGTVTLESEEAILAARNIYSVSDLEVREYVTNFGVLQDAERDLNRLKVEKTIALISQIGTVSLEDNDIIRNANAIYQTLSQEEKEKVTNANELSTAVEKLSMLREEERQKKRETELKSIVRLTKLKAGTPNSVGGVDLFIGFKNLSDKTIKYITFEVAPYNAVGDMVYCEIRDTAIFRGQATGPYAKGEGLAGNSSEYWSCAWYNSTIKSVELRSIDIEYMDGTRQTLSGEKLAYVW